MSADLIWELTKNQSCYIVKRGDYHSTGITFSQDPLNLTKSNSFKASGLANQKVFYLTYHQDFDYRHHYSFTHFHLLQKPSNDTHVHLSYRRTIKAIGAQGKSLLFRNKRGTVSKISFKRLNATKIENICGQYRIDLSNQAVKAIKRACDPATVEKVKKVRGPARK